MANLLSTTVNGQLNTGNVIDLGYTVNGSIATTAFRGINFHSFSDGNYLIGKRAGAWTQPLDITFYTGIRYHAHQAYGGHKFYTGGFDSNFAFSIGDGDANVRITNTLIFSSSNGTMISNGAMSDAIGWNSSYGTYIGSTVGGTYYIYGNGRFYDNGTIRTLIHSGNIGSQSVNYAASAGSSTSASNLQGYSAYALVQESRGYHSGSDFPNGTLVTTDIDANGWAGDSFVMEVSGKSYSGSDSPFKLIMQGYLYADTIINVSAMSYGSYFPSPVKVMRLNGNLAFWWPRGSYWNSFEVHVRNANGDSWNRVTGIDNSSDPAEADKKISITPIQVLHTSNAGYAYNMNQYVRTSDSVTFANVYTAGWFRNYGNQGIYNQDYGTHFYSNAGNTWVVTGSGGTVSLEFRSNHQSTLRGYVYADTSNNIGFLNNAGNWSLRTDSSRNTEIYGSLQVNSGTSFSGNTSWFGGYGGGSGPGIALENLSTFARFAFWGLDFYDWNHGIQMTIDNGYVSAANSFRAPIFYDSNDTTYYLDPNSSGTSLNVRGEIRNPSVWINDGDNYNDYNENIRLFNAPNGVSVIAFSASGTGGTPTTSILGFSDRLETRVGGTWEQRIYGGYVEARGSFRAPIFYDSQDLGYYVDPNATSNLAVVNVSTINPTNTYVGNAIYFGGANNYLNWTNSRIYSNVGIQSASDILAPIFYDSQNTGYYGDFASTSVMNAIRLGTSTNNGTISGGGDWGIRFANDNGWIQFGPANNSWTHIYSDKSFYFNQNLYVNGAFVAINGSSPTFQEVYANGWFRTTGNQGLYNPTNGAHFYPNNASYGSWRIDGSRNGWVGLHFESGSTLMMNSSETGIHREGYGWQFRWYNGSMFVSRGTYGGGTEYTVIDSGTIGSQSVNYATSAGSASSSSRSSALDIVGYGNGNMTYYQSSGTFAGQTGWAGYFVSNHGDGATYYNQTIIMPFWGAPQYSRLQGGTFVGPYTFWSTENLNDYAPNMNQYVRTTDNVTFNTTTSPTILVNNHSDNTRGYRIHNTSGTSVSAMFTNSSNQLVIAAGAVDQINLNKKVYVNGVALGVNVAPSATAGRIDASNDIVAYSSSDERLKENITPIENALDKVKSLTGVEFDWKPEYKHAHGYEGHDTGIIAQQVEAVMPSAVRTNDTGFLAVRYEKLIGLLIEANKELAARVEELEKKLG